MGTFTVRFEVGDPARRQFVEVEAVVDTGATHTVLPRDMLLTLGVEAVERLAFQLADEREVEYEVGEARIRLDGRERTALVVFGPEGAKALLGATTLELFNLAVDPVRRRLVPIPGLLKESHPVAPATHNRLVPGLNPAGPASTCVCEIAASRS